MRGVRLPFQLVSQCELMEVGFDPPQYDIEIVFIITVVNHKPI